MQYSTVGFPITLQSPAVVRCQLRRPHDEEFEPIRRDQLVAASIVDLALQATMDTTDSASIGLVEVRDRIIVLPFSVLHD
jgi:hypothetical protein